MINAMSWRCVVVVFVWLAVVVYPHENADKGKEAPVKLQEKVQEPTSTTSTKSCSICSYQGRIPGHEWPAFEAIYNLHKQLDDDANGNIDLEESEEFLIEELEYVGNRERKLERFHGKKNTISVDDFWSLWISSQVHNWTVEEVADWVEYHVHLHQYRDDFLTNNINGTMLPRLANSKDPTLLLQLGIVDPIHRRKITVKAMEVVLFGPPRDYLNGKNLRWIFTLVVLLFVTLALFSYRQIRISKVKLERVMKDLDRLTNAEQAFIRLQQEHEVLSSKHGYSEDGVIRSGSVEISDMEEEIKRLRKENEILCTRLKETEGKTSWKTPIDLAHWLQLTYEIETAAFNKKRQQAELQLAAARRGCDQLKKKRSNLISAFISTHGNGFEDVDGSIIQARNALMEVTRDLRERTCRWKSIERICGISIIENPGLNYLRFVLKNESRLPQSSDSGSELNATFPDHDGPLLGQMHDIASTLTEPSFSSPVHEQSVTLDSPSRRETIWRQDSDLLTGLDSVDASRPRASSESSRKLFVVGDPELEDRRSLSAAVVRVDSASRLASRMNGIPEKPEKAESVGDNQSGKLSIPSHNSTVSLALSGDLKSRKNPKFKNLFSSFTKRKKKKDLVPAP